MGYALLTKPGCRNSDRARAILRAHRMSYSVSEHDTPTKLERFANTGFTKFPAVFHDGVYIGNHEDLLAHLEE